MIFNTTRFGDVDFPDEKIIHFREGVLGFEMEKQFAVLPFTEEECPLEWLQSTLTKGLAFVVTDPNIFIPEYAINLLENEREDLELLPGNSFVLRVIVTVPDSYVNMTANLAGPLVINPEKMIGRQFVLTKPEYDTRHHLFPKDVRESQTFTS